MQMDFLRNTITKVQICATTGGMFTKYRTHTDAVAKSVSMVTQHYLLETKAASFDGAPLERTAPVLHRTIAVTAVQLKDTNNRH